MNTQGKHSLNNDTDGIKDKALNENFKEMLSNDLNQNLDNTKAPEANNTDLLNEFLEQIKPIDFEILAYPEIVDLRKKKNALEIKLTNPDGSFNGDDKEAIDELQEIMKKLGTMKVTRSHYLILIVEQLHKIAKANNWGLCKKNDSIYLFNGEYWNQLDEDQFKYFLGCVALKMKVEKFTAKYFKFKDDLHRQFLSESFLEPPKTNDKKVLINLLNGTFEIGSKQILREFRREDFLTYQLPFEYNEKATAPIFQRYLDEVLPDKEKQTVLAEYLGYIFIKNGNLKLEKALMCYGSGANGKSVLFEIVNGLLGEKNVSNYSIYKLTNEDYHRAKIADKLVNYASEINGRIEVEAFKQLVSGEPIGARLPYKEPITIRDYAKLIFNSNVLPIDVEHTDAYFRRFLIIHFDQTIPEAKQDKELAKKIIDKELSGVFNWILDGLNRLLKQKKLSECVSAENMLNNFKKESDSVKLFIDDFDYNVSDTYTAIKDMYLSYQSYCIESGYKRVNKSNFMKRLQHHKILVERKSVGYVAYVANELTNQDDFI